jgi:hypothetical protein
MDKKFKEGDQPGRDQLRGPVFAQYWQTRLWEGYWERGANSTSFKLQPYASQVSIELLSQHVMNTFRKGV